MLYSYEHGRDRESLVGTVVIHGLGWISGWDQLLLYAQQLSDWFWDQPSLLTRGSFTGSKTGTIQC
jgi:hypothetical protein